MDKNTVKDYVKNHKKELVIGAITTIGGVVLIALGCKHSKTVECKLPKVDIKDLDVPNWEVGTLTEAWEECGYMNAILNDFTLADMGKVGEEFVEKLGKDPNTSVSAMIGLLDKTDK